MIPAPLYLRLSPAVLVEIWMGSSVVVSAFIINAAVTLNLIGKSIECKRGKEDEFSNGLFQGRDFDLLNRLTLRVIIFFGLVYMYYEGLVLMCAVT